MNNRNALILAIIAIGTIFTVKYMTKSVVPYVPFADAVKRGEYVQLIGSIDKTAGIKSLNNGISFTLTDKIGRMNVFYPAVQPPNLIEADQIVVMGVYKKETNEFTADKILTKCPSKYEKKAIR